jgi:hypothetical protein
MSLIAVQGGATGTGTVTVLAPVTNTNRTLTLPDSTGTVATAESTLTQFNASGSAPVYAARAWVNFNGTGTVAIRGSGNVSSITDNGTGDYTVNFTTAMSDTNYAALITSTNRSSGSNNNQSHGYYSTDDITPVTYTTSAVRITTAKLTSTTGFNDMATVSVAVFR